MTQNMYYRGDVVQLRDEVGTDISRLALVVTPATYNAYGLTVIAPIVQGKGSARYAGFVVELPESGTQIQGAVLCNQVRTVDLQSRGIKRLATLPEACIDDVMARIRALFE
jgi:mRNA interferase ChpB